MTARKVTLLAVLMVIAATQSVAPRVVDAPRQLWNQPFHPFRIIGNIYYVGMAGISSFLISTPAGSILIDGGLKQSAPLIERSIAELGFRITDVKYIVNSHGHFDHAGGLAELKRQSGALLVGSAVAARALETGSADVPPVHVDRVANDGDVVTLGGVELTAHRTPGHSPGCMTWTTSAIENGRSYRVVLYCGTSIVYPLVGNTQYPTIAEDYEYTFGVLRRMRADVFLEMHPWRFAMERKLRKVAPGAPNPFVDPAELGRFVEQSEREFRSRLEAERKQQPAS